MATKTSLSPEEIKSNAIDNGLKVAKLVCVSSDNNNKYYDMYEQPDGTFLALRGRIDSSAVTEGPYPMSKWDSTFKSKTSPSKKPKPYTDHTHLFTTEAKISTDTTKKSVPSSNFHSNRSTPTIDFVKQLQKYANQSVAENYTVSAASVTKKQVDLAQETLNQISAMIKLKANAEPINEKLLELYQIIPRKMKKVQEFLFKERDGEDNKKLFAGNLIKTDIDLQFANDMIGREQDTLDVMAGQVAVETQEKIDNVVTDKAKKEYDLLHAMDLEMEDCDKDEIAMLKDMLNQNARSGHEKYSNNFKKAFRVKNNKTDEKFDKFMSKIDNKKKALLWHGSRNENWWSIFQQGLVLRPTNAVITGKMFGYGIYFADKAQKSINYSSYSGATRSYTGGSSSSAILAVFEVHQGKQYEIKKHNYDHSQLTDTKMDKLGFDSVFAQGGYDLVNNEYIVYKDSQCRIKYLVEIGS
jgi:poly [ADP-ribose] polymerase